jgi:hypothetical protein
MSGAWHWACCCTRDVPVLVITGYMCEAGPGTVASVEEVKTAFDIGGVTEWLQVVEVPDSEGLQAYDVIIIHGATLGTSLPPALIDAINTWVHQEPPYRRRLVITGEWTWPNHEYAPAGYQVQNGWVNALAAGIGSSARFPTTHDSHYDDSTEEARVVSEPYIADYLADGVVELGRDLVCVVQDWAGDTACVPLFLVVDTPELPDTDPAPLVVVEDFENPTGGYVGGSVVFVGDTNCLYHQEGTPDWGITWDTDKTKNVRFLYNLLTKFRYAGGPRSW